MASQCCVKLSDGWSAECSTVQWTDCALFNCPMVKQCCFKLPNAWTVLCLIVQRLDSAAFFCQTVQWLDSTVFSSPSIVLKYNFNMSSSKIVCKDNFIALNCLGGYINRIFMFYFRKMSQNFALIIRQFRIQNPRLPRLVQ